jgi:DNA mismatch repair protein MutL
VAVLLLFLMPINRTSYLCTQIAYSVPDVIQLLSEHIANQIAAGEVVQRPASAVKELMENAIDAGATDIQLIIKDAGKELIQVTDNGKGMSPTDARMSFERHATSKIRSIDDLFKIRTMGFRGEALASIAAVAQVEMKTRQASTETGSRILIEGSEVKLQEACAINPGTTIMVKNLFYNVPARRNFLKSATTELRNILDEFTRIALAHPAIGFKFWNNGVEQHHLDADSLKARVVGLLGNNYEKNLVPVEQKTDLLNIYGFVGKPQASTRTRGMQFFFINGRFIKNAYLNHAVVQAYEGLIEKDSFPFYVLFLEVDPARVDVNVHPTKQEVKFEDDKLMYSYLMAAIKHSLARYNIAPSLDFTLNPEIQQMDAVRLPFTDRQQEDTKKGYLFNTFSGQGQAHAIERNDSLRQWKSLYEIASNPVAASPTAHNESQPVEQTTILSGSNNEGKGKGSIMLVQGTYLAATVKSGMMLIHIRRAQERISYERLLRDWNNEAAASQRVLFPSTYELAPADALLLQDAIPDLVRLGFDITPLGKHTFAVQGTPPGLAAEEEKNVIDEVVDQMKHESPDSIARRTELLVAGMARRLSLNVQGIAQPEAQEALIDELFACTQPELTPDGRKTFVMLRKEQIDNMLGL